MARRPAPQGRNPRVDETTDGAQRGPVAPESARERQNEDTAESVRGPGHPEPSRR